MPKCPQLNVASIPSTSYHVWPDQDTVHRAGFQMPLQVRPTSAPGTRLSGVRLHAARPEIHGMHVGGVGVDVMGSLPTETAHVSTNSHGRLPTSKMAQRTNDKLRFQSQKVGPQRRADSNFVSRPTSATMRIALNRPLKQDRPGSAPAHRPHSENPEAKKGAPH